MTVDICNSNRCVDEALYRYDGKWYCIFHLPLTNGRKVSDNINLDSEFSNAVNEKFFNSDNIINNDYKLDFEEYQFPEKEVIIGNEVSSNKYADINVLEIFNLDQCNIRFQYIRFVSSTEDVVIAETATSMSEQTIKRNRLDGTGNSAINYDLQYKLEMNEFVIGENEFLIFSNCNLCKLVFEDCIFKIDVKFITNSNFDSIEFYRSYCADDINVELHKQVIDNKFTVIGYNKYKYKINLLFKDTYFKKQNLVSLMTVDFEWFTIINTNIKDICLVDINNIEKVNSMKDNSNSRIQVLKDLRMNYENNLEFAEAGSIYATEMSLRWKIACRKIFDFKNRKKILGYLGDAIYIGLYFISSKYGTVTLRTITIFFALLFFNYLLYAKFEIGEPLSFRLDLIASSFINLVSSIGNLVSWNSALESKSTIYTVCLIIIKLLITVIITLFVLALRRKYKR